MPATTDLLKTIWDLIKDLDDERHPHNEAYHAAVLRTKKLLKPTFDPAPEDIIVALRKEVQDLRDQVADLQLRPHGSGCRGQCCR